MVNKFFLYSSVLFVVLSGRELSASFPGLSQLVSQFSSKEQKAVPAQRWGTRIEGVRAERDKVQASLDKVRKRNADLSERMHVLKQQINTHDTSEQRFLNQKLALKGQQNSVLTEWEETLQRIVRSLDAIILTLQEQDSTSGPATPQQTVEIVPAEKAVADYSDLITAEQKVLETDSLLNEAKNNRLLLLDDISQRKSALDFAHNEYEQKHSEKEQFSSGTVRRDTLVGFSAPQQGELLDLEDRLAWYKQELAQAKVQEAERALEANEAQLDTLGMQLFAFKKAFSRIKKTVSITPELLATMKRNLDQARQKTIADRENNNSKLRASSGNEANAQRRIKELQSKYALSPAELSTIRSLNKEPKTIQEWMAVAELLLAFMDESGSHIEHELYAAQSELDKAQFRREELEVMIMHSWLRMTTHDMEFRSDDEVDQEIKQYHVIKAELEGQLAVLTRARDAAINSLHEFNVSYEKLHGLMNDFKRNQRTLFKNHPENYYELVNYFENIDGKAHVRFNFVSMLIERYSAVLTTVQGSIKRTEAIIQELKSKSFWRRSETSLLWGDFYSFLPDFARFWNDLKQRTGQFFHSLVANSASEAQDIVNSFFAEPLRLVLILVNILLIITCYFLLKFYLPDVAYYLSSVGQGYWIIHHICLAGASLLLFLMRHLYSVYVWILVFVLLTMAGHATPSLIYLKQVFYLVSIPYALWLVIEMLQALRNANKEKRYMFISEQAAPRVFIILGFMCGALVTLFCIREAFLLGGYKSSRVPIVLGAALYLVGQVSLIALLGRSQILNLIRSDTPMWEWVYDHVNRYYYIVWFLVTATIVMFNPYIGYGKQVFYIIMRLIFTAALLSFFSWIHGSVKRVSIDLFFYYADRDVLKDRFSTARYWYALLIVSALVLFLGGGLYFGARVWGVALTWHDMYQWLHHPFYTSLDEAGRPVNVTVMSLGNIALYVLAGFIGSYLVNRFVIARVLDPVIVESGVQNTVSTLLRYAFITVMLFMGLSNQGLGGLTTKLAILMAGIWFAIQDAIRDFISYFILLVQRPVKVGDFIRVLDNLSENENVSLMGFVRSITPRSIVIRKRNSTTVIVPNSRVVMNPVMNWSYTRGFFAFDDMRITVPYGTDPVTVRQLMFEVLDKNPNILKNPNPIVRLDDFVDNGYLFLVRAFLTTHKIGEQWDIAAEVRMNIVKMLREHNIEIASPVRTLRIAGKDKDSPFFPSTPSSTTPPQTHDV